MIHQHITTIFYPNHQCTKYKYKQNLKTTLYKAKLLRPHLPSSSLSAEQLVYALDGKNNQFFELPRFNQLCM